MADDGKKLYEFTQDGFFSGTFHKTGEQINLHPKQARHEAHRLKLVTSPARATAPETAPTRSTRAKA